jgi:Glycosyltransferase
MRVGIIGDVLDRQYAGIFYYLKCIVSNIDKILDKDHKYYLYTNNTELLLNRINLINYSIKSNSLFSRIYRILYRIPSLISRDRCDVVFEPAHFGPFGVPKNAKKVTFVHDITPIIETSFHPLISVIGHRILLPRILRNTDLILTNSDHTKGDLINRLGLSPNKIVRTWLGVGQQFTRSLNARTLGLYGIYKPYVLFLGTIEPRKNVYRLIRAYEQYREEYPDSSTQLIIAGKEGWNSDDVIKAKYESEFQDDIILLGYVSREDLPTLYSGADLFVYPSLYEGFGLPILEAMACGTRVATSNVTSMPEIASEHALYFDPTDITSICETIKIGLEKNWDGQEAAVHHAKSFTWERTARETLAAMEAIV